MMFNKIRKAIIITVLSVIAAYLIFLFFIRQAAPILDGIWTNEDGSFILDTDNHSAAITTADNFDILDIAYAPEPHFVMFYPPLDYSNSVYAGDFLHTGDIYRIKFFGIDYIRVKCKDECFDVWLKHA